MNTEIDMSLEAPLEGLLEKPMHLMTQEELRAHVARLHELRTSSQAFQAAIRVKSTPEPKPSLFDQF